MNMPLIVDQGSLSKGSSDMRDAIEQTRAQLGKIRGEVAASAAFWSGSAASSFTVLMMNYDDKAKKLQDALDNIAALVDKTSANHGTNEDTQDRAMNNLIGLMT